MSSSSTRRDILLGVGALSLLAGCTSVRQTAALDGPGGVTPLSFDRDEGIAALNATRRRHLLGAFAADARLQQAAQNHADYLAATGRFGHEFGGDTLFPRRIAKVGFDGSAGENLGVSYRSVEAAIKGWLDSPKHRAILLRGTFDRVGIAYAFNRSGRNPRYTHYWVMIAGRTAGSPVGVAGV